MYVCDMNVLQEVQSLAFVVYVVLRVNMYLYTRIRTVVDSSGHSISMCGMHDGSLAQLNGFIVGQVFAVVTNTF